MSPKQPIIVDFKQDYAIAEIVPHPPLLSSVGAQWQGITLDYVSHSEAEIPESYSMQHIIVIHTDASSPIYSERRMDGRFQQERIVNGDICVIPANVSHWTYSRPEAGTKDVAIILSLEPNLFAHSLPESVNPDTVKLIPHFTQPDPLIHQMGLALKAELEANPLGSRFYAESMAKALSAHLFQHYTSRQYSIPNYAGGLSKYQLRQAIDYIQAHLAENLSLKAMATEIGISYYYFCRLFKQSTGITPYQYLIKCRMERAKVLLMQRKLTIADIALEVGFSNQSHFTKHFKRLMGATPKKFLHRSQY